MRDDVRGVGSDQGFSLIWTDAVADQPDLIRLLPRHCFLWAWGVLCRGMPGRWRNLCLWAIA
ncbi:hypothetical protein D3C85_1149160 [compost metagenome]